MCGTCGCSDTDERSNRFRPLRSEHRYGVRTAPTPHLREGSRLVRLERDILHKNSELAAVNRAEFTRRGVLAVNLMSSPGSGKTSLLERTLRDSGFAHIDVIQGDQETDRDAERVRRAGARAVQVNTGRGCHLDAAMVARAFAELDCGRGTLLAIENVGNLVCPALFDLGEALRVAVISTTEGADKPLKYPHMFRACDLVLVNKIDLLEHVEFDLAACVADLRRVNPDVEVLPLSARRGDGLAAWFDWLGAKLTRCAQASTPSSTARLP